MVFRNGPSREMNTVQNRDSAGITKNNIRNHSILKKNGKFKILPPTIMVIIKTMKDISDSIVEKITLTETFALRMDLWFIALSRSVSMVRFSFSKIKLQEAAETEQMMVMERKSMGQTSLLKAENISWA